MIVKITGPAASVGTGVSAVGVAVVVVEVVGGLVVVVVVMVVDVLDSTVVVVVVGVTEVPVVVDVFSGPAGVVVVVDNLVVVVVVELTPVVLEALLWVAVGEVAGVEAVPGLVPQDIKSMAITTRRHKPNQVFLFTNFLHI
jgi:hypothetical protein